MPQVCMQNVTRPAHVTHPFKSMSISTISVPPFIPPFTDVPLCAPARQLPREQFDSIVVAGTVEAALAREGEARALAQAVQLRRESAQAWQQLRERQEALQSLEVCLQGTIHTKICVCSGFRSLKCLPGQWGVVHIYPCKPV